MKQHMKVWGFLMAGLLAYILASSVLVMAGSGTVTITAVAVTGDASFDLTVNDTTGMTVGDHFGAKIGSGAGAVYVVTAILDGTSVVVSDTLTEEQGSAFGTPALGDGWFSTPTTNLKLSRIPFKGKGWDAGTRRNAFIADIRSDLQAESAALTAIAALDSSDSRFIVGSGTGWVAESGATARTSLGLTIGTDVQAFDAQLADIAGISYSTGDILFFDGANLARLAIGSAAQNLQVVAGVPAWVTSSSVSDRLDTEISSTQGAVLYRNASGWVALPPGTNGEVLTTGGAGANPSWTSTGGTADGRQYIQLHDEKASGTNGGGSVSGSFQTRDLNVEVADTGGNASLAANQFTLDAGTYEASWSAPANAVSGHQTRLFNATDTTVVGLGGNSGSAVNGTQTRSIGFARFTIAVSKAFEIQHRTVASRAADGLGQAHSFGTEVYTVVRIYKVE